MKHEARGRPGAAVLTFKTKEHQPPFLYFSWTIRRSYISIDTDPAVLQYYRIDTVPSERSVLVCEVPLCPQRVFCLFVVLLRDVYGKVATTSSTRTAFPRSWIYTFLVLHPTCGARRITTIHRRAPTVVLHCEPADMLSCSCCGILGLCECAVL